jgi:excisionase family DNA binding protein
VEIQLALFRVRRSPDVCNLVGRGYGGVVVMMDDRPYSTYELAERWGVSDQHIRDLIRSGELQHFRVGRLIRVPAAAVREKELCQNTEPSSTGEAGTPSGQKVGKRTDARSAPKIVMKRSAA